jgi:hypothetical protein
MTTPTKQYQNISFKELIAFSQNNPNRTKTLDSIEIVAVKPTLETSLDKLGLSGYKAFALNPTGLLSLIVCIQDPNAYSFSPKNVRTQKIIDIATSLQEKTDELKNTYLARKRKKIYELIGAAYNGKVMDDKEYGDLFAGVSQLLNTNFVLMKSAEQENIEEGEKQYDSSLKGEVVFSSEPINWKREQPVWVADFRARWVAIPTENNAIDIHKILGTWLTTIEQTGWIIQWPEIDETKTELVEQLSVLPTWKPEDKKLTKDVLAVRLGRAKSIQIFTNWMSGDFIEL